MLGKLGDRWSDERNLEEGEEWEENSMYRMYDREKLGIKEEIKKGMKE